MMINRAVGFALSTCRLLSCRLIIAVVAICQLAIVSPSGGEEKAPRNWCGTKDTPQYSPSFGSTASGCPANGLCDNIVFRDAFSVDSLEPITHFHLFVQILCEDDGSNCVGTLDDLNATIAEVNDDFAPYRIAFTMSYRFINATAFRDFPTTYASETALKSTFNIKPDSFINVYVLVSHDGTRGEAQFPWPAPFTEVFGNTTGVMIDSLVLVRWHKALSHELGHCFGLYHPHRGVEGVDVLARTTSACNPCSEIPGQPSDIVGDLCSDTRAEDNLNGSCVSPATVEPCSGLPWGPPNPENIMGYSFYCWEKFSTQQAGRMHCWINSALTSWIRGVRILPDTVLGAVPLSVSPRGVSNVSVTNWSWDFGDGTSSTESAPTHVYSTPGVYDIRVTATTDSGAYSALIRDAAVATADTLSLKPYMRYANNSMQAHVCARNIIPLSVIQAPIEWGSYPGLQLDSLSVNLLRTHAAGIEISNLTFESQMTVVLRAPATDTETVAPDTGAILRVFFTATDPTAIDTGRIELDGYDSYLPNFVGRLGVYRPVTTSGVHISQAPLCGDIDSSEDINIGDAVFLIYYLFVEGAPAPALDYIADVDGNSSIDIGDATFIVNFIFTNGAVPLCR